jgi:hypothetical protein
VASLSREEGKASDALDMTRLVAALTLSQPAESVHL